MSEIFPLCSCQLMCFFNQYYLTLNVGYFPDPTNIYQMKYRHINYNINVNNLYHAVFE